MGSLIYGQMPVLCSLDTNVTFYAIKMFQLNILFFFNIFPIKMGMLALEVLTHSFLYQAYMLTTDNVF